MKQSKPSEDTVKLSLHIVVTYDANPDHYGTDDPKKMAKIDQTSFRENSELIPEMLRDRLAKIYVKPIHG